MFTRTLPDIGIFDTILCEFVSLIIIINIISQKTMCEIILIIDWLAA